MNDDKQEVIDELLDKQRPIWVTMVKAIVISIVVVLILIGCFIGFLQMNTFQRVQEQMGPDTYTEGLMDTLSYGEEGFLVNVPEGVIARVLASQIVEEVKTRVNLESYYYDGLSRRLDMNLSYLDFYIPLSLEVTFEQMNQGITCKYDLLTIGPSHWQPKGWLLKLMSNRVISSTFSDRIDLSTIGVPSEVRLEQMTLTDEGMALLLKVDEEAIEQEIALIGASVDPLLLKHYKDFSSERTAPVLGILGSQQALSHEQIQLLVNDMLGNKFIVSDLLLITQDYNTSGLEALMEAYGLSLDLATIAMERKAFSGQAIDPDIAQIFTALDAYFEDKIMALNQGKPFDIETMTTMTVQRLVALNDLAIDEEILKKLTFVYDDAFHVAFQLDQDTFYIRGLEGYEVIDKGSYEAILGAGPFIEASYVEDLDVWEGVVSAISQALDTEGLFVRYMKSDGTSVFAVVSTYQAPQEVISIALTKHEASYSLIADHVTSIAGLLAEQGDFNAETATLAIEEASFERIGDDIQELIIDELYDQRKIASKSDTSIVYSSYDGNKYITFKLSTGDEYVYKVENTVYGTYLSTVYTKAKAIRNWTDLPELLILQDPPQP